MLNGCSLLVSLTSPLWRLSFLVCHFKAFKGRDFLYKLDIDGVKTSLLLQPFRQWHLSSTLAEAVLEMQLTATPLPSCIPVPSVRGRVRVLQRVREVGGVVVEAAAEAGHQPRVASWSLPSRIGRRSVEASL